MIFTLDVFQTVGKFSDGLAECFARKSNDKKTLIYQVRIVTMNLLRGK